MILAFILLGVVAMIALGMFVLAANVGGRGMLMLSVVVLLIGAGITLFAINALGETEAAPPVTHHQSLYTVKHEKPADWNDFVNDPYFMVFAGIVVALWGVAGCIGYGFAKE
jgi:hypothetical protein